MKWCFRKHFETLDNAVNRNIDKYAKDQQDIFKKMREKYVKREKGQWP